MPKKKKRAAASAAKAAAAKDPAAAGAASAAPAAAENRLHEHYAILAQVYGYARSIMPADKQASHMEEAFKRAYKHQGHRDIWPFLLAYQSDASKLEIPSAAFYQRRDCIFNSLPANLKAICAQMETIVACSSFKIKDVTTIHNMIQGLDAGVLLLEDSLHNNPEASLLKEGSALSLAIKRKGMPDDTIRFFEEKHYNILDGMIDSIQAVSQMLRGRIHDPVVIKIQGEGTSLSQQLKRFELRGALFEGASQKLKDENDALKAKNDALKAENDALQAQHAALEAKHFAGVAETDQHDGNKAELQALQEKCSRLADEVSLLKSRLGGERKKSSSADKKAAKLACKQAENEQALEAFRVKLDQKIEELALEKGRNMGEKAQLAHMQLKLKEKERFVEKQLLGLNGHIDAQQQKSKQHIAARQAASEAQIVARAAASDAGIAARKAQSAVEDCSRTIKQSKRKKKFRDSIKKQSELNWGLMVSRGEKQAGLGALNCAIEKKKRDLGRLQKALGGREAVRDYISDLHQLVEGLMQDLLQAQSDAGYFLAQGRQDSFAAKRYLEQLHSLRGHFEDVNADAAHAATEKSAILRELYALRVKYLSLQREFEENGADVAAKAEAGGAMQKSQVAPVAQKPPFFPRPALERSVSSPSRLSKGSTGGTISPDGLHVVDALAEVAGEQAVSPAVGAAAAAHSPGGQSLGRR